MMSDSLDSLQRKISNAQDLAAVVRAMKALSASSIVQYERALQSLGEYAHTVELGLFVWLRQSGTVLPLNGRVGGCGKMIGAVVFGSDQGLVGQFNEMLAAFASESLAGTETPYIWAVGERMRDFLDEAGLRVSGQYPVPNSIAAIAPLVGRILMEIETLREQGRIEQVYLFNNRPVSGGGYSPAKLRLLPLDESWLQDFLHLKWPDKNLPEVIGAQEAALKALIREYLFIILFRTCAESLASEHASRLAAMQRAEKNIDEIMEALRQSFHLQRQNTIDEELFDVIAGFEALVR